MKKKGFTLAELLVVVAIIGVLVAVSIPIFSKQLEKSRIATDQANVRSAKAAAAAEYMSNGESGSVSYLYNNSTVTKIDLTNSSYDMYANMPDSVEEIVLPSTDKDGYDIQGRWYTADGKWNPSRYYGNRNGTRITKSQNGQTIYKDNPKS